MKYNPLRPTFYTYSDSWVNSETGKTVSSVEYFISPWVITKILNRSSTFRTQDFGDFEEMVLDLERNGARIISDRLPGKFRAKVRSRISLTNQTTIELQRRPVNVKKSVIDSSRSLKIHS